MARFFARITGKTAKAPLPEASAAAASASQQPAVRAAGFVRPRQLYKEHYGPGADMALRSPPFGANQNGQRQRVLWETLDRLERASPTAHFHVLAAQNLERWRLEAGARSNSSPARGTRCEVRCVSGDWGVVAGSLTKEFGRMFAVLNMANASYPGGGYTHGCVAQEENMFRRTDCHFSLSHDVVDTRTGEYTAEMTDLINASDGRVYLDVERPRVCLRGPEDRKAGDLGYRFLEEHEVFPFVEMRAAAVNLMGRGRAAFSAEETARRVRAQFQTLLEHGVRAVVLSAFGCGAFANPAAEVAAAYRRELERCAGDFDVVVFAVFHAGYGPDNFPAFAAAFEGWA